MGVRLCVCGGGGIFEVGILYVESDKLLRFDRQL